MPIDVNFPSAGLQIAALLHVPDRPNGRTLVVGHPGTAVKEQAPALYAARLCARGFTVLTFDAACQGASEGLPRSFEDPAQRVEDFRAAVSWLATQPSVDPARIGLVGICASGGYVMMAAAGDRRVAAVAGVVAVDVGRQLRVGADGRQGRAVLDALLDAAAADRSRVAAGAPVGLMPVFPSGEAEARAAGGHVWEGWDYYCTPRSDHPRAAKALTWSSIDRMATFDAFGCIDLIAPGPLLMITAEHAVTAWMTREAIEAAQAPKTLHVVPGATHVDLYDRAEAIDDAMTELTRFFTATL